MSRSLPDRFHASPRSIRALPGETEGTKGADPDLLRGFGRVVARARELAGWTQQELAFRLGHADHTRVSKWEAGLENPQMARLFALDGYQQAFAFALAELPQTGARLHLTVVFDRRRSA